MKLDLCILLNTDSQLLNSARFYWENVENVKCQTITLSNNGKTTLDDLNQDIIYKTHSFYSESQQLLFLAITILSKIKNKNVIITNPHIIPTYPFWENCNNKIIYRWNNPVYCFLGCSDIFNQLLSNKQFDPASLLDFLNNNSQTIQDFIPSSLTKNSNIKIIFLIIASFDQPVYLYLYNIWKKYLHLSPNIEGYFIFADSSFETKIENDIILIRGEERKENIITKTIEAFKLLQNKQFDFLVRTNLSSFWDFEKFISFISNIPKQKFYGGTKGKHNDIEFISGTDIIMSRDVFNMFLNFNNTTNIMDDVDIGNFISSRSIELSNLNIRYEIISTKKGSIKDWINEIINIKNFSSSFVYRNRYSKDINMRYNLDYPIYSALLNVHYNLSISTNRFNYLTLLKQSLLDILYESKDINDIVIPQFNIINGNFNPKRALTNIGIKRLNNIEYCIRKIIENKIEGDILNMETNKGGTSIFMKAILKSYNNNNNKKIYIINSQDESANEIRSNLIKYLLLDEKIIFDTLKNINIRDLAILRLDKNTYSNILEMLTTFYDKLNYGGYIIINDYTHNETKTAIDNYRKDRNINSPIFQIDMNGVYWQIE